MSKTTSPELSKQLKEAGAKQESEKYRVGDLLLNKLELCRGMDFVSSFDCYELLDGLPMHINVSQNLDDTEVWGYSFSLVQISGGYLAQYLGIDGPEGDYVGDFSAHTPAEALGKLYLWCLENGHIK